MVGTRLFHRYLFSIAGICFAVLLVASFVTYGTLRGLVETEVEQATISQLRQTRSIFDATHSAAIATAVQVTNDPNVNRLMYADELSPGERLRGMEQINSALQALAVADSVIVYNYRMGTVFAAYSGIYPLEAYPDQDLIDIVRNARAHGTFRYIPRRIDERNVFTILIGDAPITGRELRGALIVQISEQELRDVLQSGTDSGPERVAILDRDGTILSHGDPSRFGRSSRNHAIATEVLQMSGPEGSFNTRTDGSSYLVSYVAHAEFGWRFYSVADHAELYGGLRRARNRTAIGLGVLALLSMLASVLTSLRLYRPIGSVYTAAALMDRELYGTDKTEATNEIEYLTEFLDHTRAHLDRWSRVHRDETIAGLLRGTTRTRDLAEDHPFRVGADNPPVGVAIVVRVDGHYDLFQSHGDLTAGWKSGIASALGKAAPEATIVDSVGSDDVVALFESLSHDRTSDDARARFQLVADVVENLSGNGTTYTIGVSRPGRWPLEARSMYWEARQATNYRFREGPGARIVYSPELEGSGETAPDPIEASRPVVAAILSGKPEEVRGKLARCARDFAGAGYEQFRYGVQALLDHSYRELSSRGILNDENRGQILFLRDQLDWLEFPSDIERFLTPLYETLARANHLPAESKSAELVDHMLRVIREQYRDPNASSESVAGECGISTNYARHMVKKITGRSINQWINELRVEQCKRKLLQSDVQVKTMYAQVGFRNYNYFFSLFKRIVGCTPVQYKRKHSKS